MDTPFIVNGQPFFILGGQVHNSSGYGLPAMQAAWPALTALKANTAEVPVYWEQVEPQEGIFTFAHLDDIIQAARQRDLHLVLLWFATWKNGNMQYAPGWVKADPARFPRVVTPAGSTLWVLSSHSAANLDADRRAFCQLISHLKDFDASTGTVIAIQIENEPGILGSVRDHSPQADAEFAGPVPLELINTLFETDDSPVKTAWLLTGPKEKDVAWAAAFGEKAGEYFSAWSIAHYIDAIAAAGKKIYDLPMYVNVWLAENGWRRPGSDYPSGGAASQVVDLWKWAASHIDLIAPDIYITDSRVYRRVRRAYTRPDNPLFVPESGGTPSNSLLMFEAIAQSHAIGYAIFGVESLLAADGSVKPGAKLAVESFRCLASALPLITRFHKTGSIYAVGQHEFMTEQLFDFGAYWGMARFQTGDYFNPPDKEERGRGLIFLAGENEFYLVGAGYSLMLKEKTGEVEEFSKPHDRFDGHMTHYLSVEEGHFAADGSWVVDHRRNGDEVGNGLWVTLNTGVVHAVLTNA
jgi:Domain of unknown function (DUF5597)/Beta-galactosidase